MSYMSSCNKNSNNYSHFYRLCEQSKSTACTSNTKFLPPGAPVYDCNYNKPAVIPVPIGIHIPPQNTTQLPIQTSFVESVYTTPEYTQTDVPVESVKVNFNEENISLPEPKKEVKKQQDDKDNNDRKFNKKTWGAPAWDFLHAGTWAYPENPSKQQQTLAKIFYEALPYQLPCGVCEGHCANYIRDNPPVTKNRETLTRWLHQFHNAVNKRLGKEEYPWENLKKRFSPEDLSGNFCIE